MRILKTGNAEDFYHLWETFPELEDFRGSGMSLCQIASRYVLCISIIEQSLIRTYFLVLCLFLINNLKETLYL